MSFLAALLYTRAQLAQLMATEFSSVAAIPADTSPGSVLNSVFNSKALLAVGVIQAQVEYVASIIFLSTIPALASGYPNPDVDNFVNAFNVFRKQATNSTGQVTISTSSAPSQPILIPAVAAGSTGGVIVQTSSGVQFQVIIDTTNSAYNTTLQGYVIEAGSTSVNCTVQCLSDGTQGNVAAGQINQLFSGPGVTSVAGVASVTNASAFTNASAVETDVALKSRFAETMSTGTVATANAIAAAVDGVALNLTYSVGDGLNAEGTAQSSYFTVVVNNANTATSPSSTLLTEVYNAVLAVRTLGISFDVIAPTLLTVSATGNVKIAPGYSQSAVAAACAAAFASYVDGIGLDPQGNATYCTIAKAYFTLMSVPGVVDVTSLQLNGAGVDIAAPFAHQCVSGTAVFTPYN